MNEKNNHGAQEEISAEANKKLSLNGTDYQTVITPEMFDALRNEVQKLRDEFDESKDDFKKSRFDIITILAVFVGLITYLGLEIQVFKEISNPLVIIGVSIFFIASILLFILTINMILKESDITWKKFWNPLFVILSVLLILSVSFIIYGYIEHFYFTH